MNRNKYKCGEKKVKYALRKLSQGVFSVAIGSALFYSGPIMNNVHADAISNADKVIQGLQNKDSNFAKVELIPILKSELNNNEKSKITKNLPKITVNKNQKYYLVYQKNSQNILPKTNEVKSSINYLFIGSSIVLASWILLSKKARKSKFLFSVLLLNSFSGVQVLGLTMSNDQLLNRYKQTVEVPVGSSLPNIDVNIPGYEFLGYAPVENYSGKNDILKSNIGNKKPEENIKEVKSYIATEKDKTVTEVIPYTTKTVDNPELEEGITKVKTAGENGIRSIIYKVTYDATGKEINRVEVSNTVTKAPVEEVIERGTKPKVTTTEKDETVTEVIPYTTKTIDNPELEEGITKVKTAGENGIRSIVYKVTYDATGKEINRVEVSNTVTKAPVEEVIERGTKPKVTTTEKDETVTEVIPYTTKTVDNPELEEGITKVKTAGENGIRSIVYKVTYDATGKEINRVEVSNTVTKAPVEEVIERGTKPKVTTTEKDETVTEVIPYTTKTVDNPELEEGITKVKTAGENGIRSIVYKVTYDATGKEINRVEVSNTVTKAPVEEVIERGTKPKVTTTEKDETVTEVIPYTTKTVDNPELEEGITKVKTAGENGIRSIVYKVTYDATGKEINRVEVSNTVTKAPVEEVIERGTKPKVTTTEKDETVTEVIPYTTKTVDNPELEEGITKVKTAGENGIRSIVYKVTYDATGKEINRVEVSNTVTKAPVEEVIERGTKPKVTTTEKDETVTEVIPYTTKTVDNPELEEGITKVKTAGKNGIRSIIYKVTYDATGKEINRVEVSNTITKVPVEEVIERGTKPKVTTTEKDETVTEVIPYTTKTIDNPELEEGITKVKTAGENGIRSIVYKVTYDATGKEINRVEVSNTITKAPVEEIIERGTKKVKIDKNKLETVIDQAKTYQENQYTTASWDVLRKALSSAEQTFNDTNSTQEQVDQAVSTLQASIKQLEKKPVNKEQLKQLIDQIKTYQENQYTTASWDVLRKALSSAEQLFNNPQATQKQIDQMTTELNESIKQLKKIEVAPTVSIASIVPNIDQKSASITYHVEDKDQTIKSITVKVYENKILKEEKKVDLATYKVFINNLAYNTQYTLETVYTYAINNQPITENQTEKQVIELTPKKLEITNFKNIKLYEVGKNGELTNIIGLSKQPQNLSNYIVRVNSINNKDLLLPIQDIQEVNVNGVSKYKVTINYPELVTYDPMTNDYVDNYSFYINKIVQKQNVYTNFTDLVQAINNDPTGNFTIGTDLAASDLTPASNSYITGIFSGTLTSEAGHTYSIYNLTKPLFQTINNGTVKNINLVEVNIAGNQSNVGALAKTATHATIENIHAEGKISAPINVGGLVYTFDQNSKLMNSSFTGTINITTSNNYFIGGLIGVLNGQSTIENSYANIDITASANHNDNKIGGLVGQSYSNTLIKNSYVTGKINNIGSAGFVGGIIGSSWYDGKLQNVISAVDVQKGNLIHGDTGYTYAPFTNVYYVENVAKGNSYENATAISQSRANELLTQWNIKVVPLEKGNTVTDYSNLVGYQKDREIAYHNMEKLIPLYDRYTILHYGNKVNNHSKLYTSVILSVTPMIGHTIVTNIFNQLDQINQLMIHYEDGTIEMMQLTNPKPFKNTKMVEFQLGDQLIYTPLQFQGDFTHLANQVLSTFHHLDFLSVEMLKKFGFMWTAEELKAAQDKAVADYKNNNKTTQLTAEKEQQLRNQATQDLAETKYNKLRDMYLLESFNAVKKDLPNEIQSILINGTVVDMDSLGVTNYLTHQLESQAQNILLGLAYINRLYNVNYGDINIKNLAMYRADFYGKKVSLVDWLASFGNMSYESLQVKNNYNTYSLQFAPITGQANLIDYLDYNKKLFVPNMSENDWFKSSTKAFIYEAHSKEVPNALVDIYPRLKGIYRQEYRNFILPLLNLTSNNVFAVTNMSTITFGLYERYIDEALKKTPAVYEQKVKEFDEKLLHYGDLWAGYYDTWYRIADDKVKNQLFTRDIPVWDGYWIIDNTQSGYWKNRWVGRYDTSVPAMMEFFGAIGKWYDPNGTGAYANGNLVHFVVDAVVSDYGTSTLTHEMTHNFDGGIYLNGYGRRNGQYAENFAMGLLQSPYSKDDSTYGLNLVFNWDENALRSQNYSPSRFQSDKDVSDYMHGVFDVTYLLDYLEAKVSLEKPKEDQKLLYRKMTFENGTDKVVAFTDAEWDQMNLKTVNDLIDNNVVSKRYYDNASVGQNSYYTISMYAPIYAGLQNSNGASGGIIFRKTAFELLAAKGWDNGFVAYASNEYEAAAKAEHKTLSDEFIIQKIFGQEYKNYADFKKAMFQERINKKDLIKPITINWNGPRMIHSFNELEILFQDALNKDLVLAKQNRNMHYMDDLKAQVMQAYHLLTHDFEQSIFQ
ncbi:YSIRK-type signal peptide-containing protein (plasmid) [Enterococcus hirae]|uniref:G5 domain-containing protein n=3 Tax=Enterococcus TaxID=1350 RepID=UPI0016293E35|nr:ZmpA/ZmpB/ZmpC family metallo-endopeptidase [Enterococcus hirae]QNG06943.1 YSIRK-type signal peptide-containing protein [Enterococcus hirae]